MKYNSAIPWWRRSDEEIPEAVFSEIRNLRFTQSYRRNNLLRHYRLYSHRMLQGLDASNYAKDLDLPDSRLRLNVVQPVVDTAHSMIATNRPRVQFTTSKADWRSVSRAEKRSAFVDGQFAQVGLFEITPDVCKDAEIAGYGAIKIAETEDDIKVIRVLPEEMEWDDIEAKHGNPRSLYYVVEKSIDHMAALHPEFESQIRDSGLISDGFMPLNATDLLTAVECWHLPSKKGANDGVHVICTSRALLLKEKWEPEEFPILVWRWNKMSRGYDAQGLPEQLRGIQLEINRLLYKIQRHMAAASSKIALPKGSEVDPNTTNEEFEKIWYKGPVAPVFMTVKAISREYFEHLDRLYARAFEITGVNQLQAQGLKPAGLDSAPSIRAYNDLQTKRFLSIGQSWEQFHVAAAERLIAAGRRLAKRSGKSYKVRAELGGKLIDLDWSDVAMEEDEYRIQAWPVGILPVTPAGQYQLAVELTQGFPQLAPFSLDLLSGDPDLKRAISRVQAPHHLAEKIIERIIEDGTIMSPEPLWLPYMGQIVEQVQLAYIEALVGGVDEEHLDMFRSWLKAAVSMRQIAEAEAMAAAMPPGGLPGLPGAAPGAPGLPPPGQPGLPAGLTSSKAALALPAPVKQPI